MTDEPFGYWIEQKGAEPTLLRKPAYIPEPNEFRTVTPLFVRLTIRAALKRERESCARTAQRYVENSGCMTRHETSRGVAHEIRNRPTLK